MAPILALLVKALIPVAVSEVQRKLSDSGQDSTIADAAVPALKAVSIGSVKSKTAWVAGGLVVVGALEQSVQLISSVVPADKLGYIVAGLGAVSWFLRALTTESLVEKSEPKE